MVKMAKRKITPLKKFDTNQDLQEFIDQEKAWMYGRIVEAIISAHNNLEDRAVILEAKIRETMSVVTMNADKSEWTNSLSLALKWYESVEEFEKCSEVIKLLEHIKTDTPFPIKKK